MNIELKCNFPQCYSFCVVFLYLIYSELSIFDEIFQKKYYKKIWIFVDSCIIFAPAFRAWGCIRVLLERVLVRGLKKSWQKIWRGMEFDILLPSLSLEVI